MYDNLLSFYTHFIDKYLLVMELASRGNLLDYLHHKRIDRLEPLTVHEALSFAKQIALGMEYLASQQVIMSIIIVLLFTLVCSVSIVT